MGCSKSKLFGGSITTQCHGLELIEDRDANPSDPCWPGAMVSGPSTPVFLRECCLIGQTFKSFFKEGEEI